MIRILSTRAGAEDGEGTLKAPETHDASAFEHELRASVRGEVHFEDAYRAMYSTDASNYRQVPVAVVLPRDARDAQRAMLVCSHHGVAATPRGGGTSLSGASCNVAVIFDYSKYMNRILELDPEKRTARVEPGVVLDDLRNEAAKFDLTFGPAPSTHNRCNIGGMFGNNACGMPAQFSGRMEESVIAAEVLLYDGTRMNVGATSEKDYREIISAGGRKAEIYRALRRIWEEHRQRIHERFPDFPRRVSGYNLNELDPQRGFHVARALTGTEGTCVHALELTLRLVPKPKHKAMALVGFQDIAAAGDHVARMNEFSPHALEGMDVTLFQHMHEKGLNPHSQEELFPNGSAWLVAEFGGETREQAQRSAQECVDGMKRSSERVTGADATADPHVMQEINQMREAGLGVTSKIPNEPDFYPGWEDAAVPAHRLGEYLREFQQKLQEYGYNASIYGHFGQGCVHCSINFDLFTAEGIRNYRNFVTEMAKIVTRYGGSISGEHGDGQARGELLSIMYGEEIVQAFWDFKSAFDPRNRMNPGKVVHPNRLDENLRWGVDYEPWEPQTFMPMREDRGTFHYAANRCVGAGVCRKHDKGTMCPSYMVTKEERYSTRGRARLLFEMLQGNPLRKTWNHEAIRESLDYCLACKGCKHECPVNVDMATYKAEFLYHFYKGKLRPLHMWLFGYMFKWAKAAALAPDVVNFFTQAPPFSTLLKKLGSIAPQRAIPMFAPQTFRQWYARRTPRVREGAERVVLWVDTWNEHFHPQTAIAALEVLEDAGYNVIVPGRQICCGRPLYDYGLLEQARRQLLAILEELRPLIREGVPLVGLEPSCLSVFKDEMQNMLHGDLDAGRLAAQTFALETFLEQKSKEDRGYRPPRLARHAVVHEHCHKKSLLNPNAETHLFGQMQMDFRQLESGCCGMAGAFGFEKSHYEMSVACGERVLLPEVRDASAQSIVVADGFSCREQIAQTTSRVALHPAEVMKMAIEDRGIDRDEPYPERRFEADPRERRRRIVTRGYAALAAAFTLGIAAAALWKRR